MVHATEMRMVNICHLVCVELRMRHAPVLAHAQIHFERH